MVHDAENLRRNFLTRISPLTEHPLRNEVEHAIKCLKQTQYAEDAPWAVESEKTQVAHEDERKEESAAGKSESGSMEEESENWEFGRNKKVKWYFTENCKCKHANLT